MPPDYMEALPGGRALLVMVTTRRDGNSPRRHQGRPGPDRGELRRKWQRAKLGRRRHARSVGGAGEEL